VGVESRREIVDDCAEQASVNAIHLATPTPTRCARRPPHKGEGKDDRSRGAFFDSRPSFREASRPRAATRAAPADVCRLPRPLHRWGAPRWRPTGHQTNEKGRQNADRRCSPTSAPCGAALPPPLPSPACGRTQEGAARLSAFHRGSDRWALQPAGATSGHVSWDEAGRSALYGSPNRGRKTLRSSTGVTRARQSQSRDAPPGPVVVPVS
jgi:hypothetical protein